MLLKAFDIITTFYQSVLFVWITNNITSKDNKRSRLAYGFIVCGIFSNIIIFTYSGINIPLANLFMVMIILSLIILSYRKYILDALIGFSLTYSIIAITSYSLFMLYSHISSKLGMSISPDVQMIIFIYIPVWIVYSLVYIFRKYIIGACITMKSLKQPVIFILLIDYALIILDTLSAQWVSQGTGEIFKSFLCFAIFIAFVFAVIYFAKINDKAREVELLNEALNEKIVELKKIKHDYGSEISSLYGLYQMGKMDRIGVLLKGIVERYQGVSTNLNVSVQATPLVASVLGYAIKEEVNVMSFDGCNYENLSITENELLQLLSNIVKNSVEVVRDIKNPTIKFKSYDSYNGIIINIENNGPEIPKEIRNKIFLAGFSTKDNNSSDRGYGLSIVNDIIKNCNGKITVESSKDWTLFKLEIPYKAM